MSVHGNSGDTPIERTAAEDRRPLSLISLSLLALIVGVVTGFGAVGFRDLIGLIHNMGFLGQFIVHYDANVFTPPSPWGALVILVPVVGALGVTYLVSNFAPEAKGHGVPEVMDAIYYGGGIIRPVVAVVKSLASALAIGTGSAVGREGPIIQIGSALGSTFGQIIKMPPSQRITLVAAGAGAGIAATFNTPIGGVLFAAELLLHEVSVWTLVPVVISTAIATYIGRIFLGDSPSFLIPTLQIHSYHPSSPIVLAACIGLGCLIGLVSVLFIRSIYAFEDFFDQKVPGNYYSRHVLGMLMVGIIIFLMWRFSGHYYIQGVGYATVQDVLTGGLGSFWFLLLLFALKLAATSLTLGSGGSGGIFSPSLFLGATVGGAFGILLLRWLPFLPATPAAFAVMGMAGVVAGVTGAAITAIVMIFEMTRDYNVILPMTIAVAISYGVRKVLCRESIYTLKLTRRGHHMPESMQSNFPLVRLARDIMDPRVCILPASTSLHDLPRILAGRGAVDYLLAEGQRNIVGILKRDAALDAVSRDGAVLTIGDLAIVNFETVAENVTLLDIISRMHSTSASLFLVSAASAPGSTAMVKGVITKEQIADAMTETVSLSQE